MIGIIYFENNVGVLDCWEVGAWRTDTTETMEEHFNKFKSFVNGLNFIGAEIWNESNK